MRSSYTDPQSSFFFSISSSRRCTSASRFLSSASGSPAVPAASSASSLRTGARAGRDAVLGLGAEMDLLVERAVLGAHVRDLAAGEVERVLGAELERVRGAAAEVELAGEEAEHVQRLVRHGDRTDLALGLVELL